MEIHKNTDDKTEQALLHRTTYLLLTTEEVRIPFDVERQRDSAIALEDKV